jgi:hypothetical protein
MEGPTRRRLTALAFAALAGTPLAGHAQGVTGAVLLEACQARLTGRPGFDSGLCLGTIAGALQAHEQLLPKEEALYCLGRRSMDNDQIVRLVVKWLKAHPERHERPGGGAVLFALREEFPCSAAEAASAPSK